MPSGQNRLPSPAWLTVGSRQHRSGWKLAVVGDELSSHCRVFSGTFPKRWSKKQAEPREAVFCAKKVAKSAKRQSQMMSQSSEVDLKMSVTDTFKEIVNKVD